MPDELQAFVAEVVNLPSERLKRYRETVDHLLATLQQRIDADGAFGLKGTIHSGSIAKKTAISTSSDMDVAVYLRPRSEADEFPDRLLDYVRDRLREVYPEKHGDITVGRHAVRVRFHDAALTVDVVPIISEAEADGWGKLLDQHSGEWIDTSIRAHRDAILRWKANHPNYCELVRLTKWWRSTQQLRFRSFIIELLWGYLLDTRTISSEDLGESLLGFFAYVVRSKLGEPICFDQGARAARQSGDHAPVHVADPVNPANNVAGRMTEDQRDAVVRACRQGLADLAAAQTALDRTTARECYQRLFGPRFTHEAGRPADASPDVGQPAREIASKIHSDLRQLRVLSQQFRRETEIDHARSMELWLDSGFAATIELAFCEGNSFERRWSVRYVLNDKVPSIEDGGGLLPPVPDLQSTTFRIQVSGKERWGALDGARREAFLRGLPGTWGMGQSLSGGVAGEVDRRYASGDLVVDRSFVL
jgi:hypothetical protein